jgi:hypothetical protein
VEPRSFETVLERRGAGVVCRVPFDVRDAFGRARPPVSVTVGGHTFRTTVATYGGMSYLGLNRDVRAAAGVDAGDRVVLAVSLDEAPRVVEVPADLQAALAGDEVAAAAFEALSFTHRKEYAAWVAGAKRNETRRNRVERAVSMLREGVRHP